MKQGIKINLNYPHLGLIKLDYAIYKYLPTGEIDPSCIQSNSETIILNLIGQNKEECIKKVEEFINETIRRSKSS